MYITFVWINFMVLKKSDAKVSQGKYYYVWLCIYQQLRLFLESTIDNKIKKKKFFFVSLLPLIIFIMKL